MKARIRLCILIWALAVRTCPEGTFFFWSGFCNNITWEIITASKTQTMWCSLPVWSNVIQKWPRHAQKGLRACADNRGPDQPAHPRSLIRALTASLQNHWILQNVWMESKDPDDTLRMRMMNWICASCAYLKALFGLKRHILISRQFYLSAKIIRIIALQTVPICYFLNLRNCKLNLGRLRV